MIRFSFFVDIRIVGKDWVDFLKRVVFGFSLPFVEGSFFPGNRCIEPFVKIAWFIEEGGRGWPGVLYIETEGGLDSFGLSVKAKLEAIGLPGEVDGEFDEGVLTLASFLCN